MISGYGRNRVPLSKTLRHRELGERNIRERYLVDEDGNCIVACWGHYTDLVVKIFELTK